MSDTQRAPREDWGQVFRDFVSNARVGAYVVLVASFWAIDRYDGLAQVFAVIVGLVALVAAFPKSPLIPAIVEWIPGLPSKGSGA